MANSEPNLRVHAEIILKALNVIEEYVSVSNVDDEYLRKEMPEALTEAKSSLRVLSRHIPGRPKVAIDTRTALKSA